MAYTVLVVDDSRFMREHLRMLLTNSGCDVIDTDNGVSAVTMYENCRPDLVTLDILMPGQDGVETLKQIFNIDPNANVIMVTALGMEDYVLEAMKLGASGCIIKPFKQEHINKVLAEVLDEEFFAKEENKFGFTQEY